MTTLKKFFFSEFIFYINMFPETLALASFLCKVLFFSMLL